jgi:hypothetical protein
MTSLALASFLFGCATGGDETTPHDAGTTLDCVDEDGDGFGVGADCQGTDCNDANRNAWLDSDCARGCEVGAHEPGCECDPAKFPDPEECYTGPDGTAGVGNCALGQRACTEEWGACEGQVLPTKEDCNYEDDDCDGEVDEEMAGACGCGLTVGIGCADAFEIDGDDVATAVDVDGALRLAGGQTDGTWSRHFEEPCTAEVPNPFWTTLHWDGEAPAGTTIAFEARRENCGGDPGVFTWVPIATVPSDEPPVDMVQPFLDDGQPAPQICLGIRITLHTDAVLVSPRVTTVAPNLECR